MAIPLRSSVLRILLFLHFELKSYNAAEMTTTKKHVDCFGKKIADANVKAIIVTIVLPPSGIVPHTSV